MNSKRRMAANKANAQKSTGPKTPAGKEASSRNAGTHGLCATTFVLANEDFDSYLELRDEYVDRFDPRDPVEHDLVERMAHASWNLRRAWTMQNEAVDFQMLRMEADLKLRHESLPDQTRTLLAYEEISKEPTFPLLLRYEARQSNEYQRALKTLLQIRKIGPVAPRGPINVKWIEPVTPTQEPPVQTNPIPQSDTYASDPLAIAHSADRQSHTPPHGATMELSAANQPPAPNPPAKSHCPGATAHWPLVTGHSADRQSDTAPPGATMELSAANQPPAPNPLAKSHCPGATAHWPLATGHRPHCTPNPSCIIIQRAE